MVLSTMATRTMRRAPLGPQRKGVAAQGAISKKAWARLSARNVQAGGRRRQRATGVGAAVDDSARHSRRARWPQGPCLERRGHDSAARSSAATDSASRPAEWLQRDRSDHIGALPSASHQRGKTIIRATITSHQFSQARSRCQPGSRRQRCQASRNSRPPRPPSAKWRHASGRPCSPRHRRRRSG